MEWKRRLTTYVTHSVASWHKASLVALLSTVVFGFFLQLVHTSSLIHVVYKVCPESNETDSRKFVYLKICLNTLNILQNNILEHQYTVARGSATRRSSPGSLEMGSLAEHSPLQPAARPKMASFQAGFEPGKQKEIGRGQRCPSLPTAQTWHRPISICFPGSNPAWKDTILGVLKTCCKLQWRMFCKRSQFKTSRRATTRGRTAGNGVLMLKDVILKNIKCV